MLVKGDKNSSLKLEVLNTTQLKLSVDADGDGAYEISKTVLWTDLMVR